MLLILHQIYYLRKNLKVFDFRSLELVLVKERNNNSS